MALFFRQVLDISKWFAMFRALNDRRGSPFKLLSGGMGAGTASFVAMIKSEADPGSIPDRKHGVRFAIRKVRCFELSGRCVGIRHASGCLADLRREGDVGLPPRTHRQHEGQPRRCEAAGPWGPPPAALYVSRRLIRCLLVGKSCESRPGACLWTANVESGREVVPQEEQGNQILHPHTEPKLRMLSELRFFGREGGFLRAFLEQGCLFCSTCRGGGSKGLLAPVSPPAHALCKDCECPLHGKFHVLGCPSHQYSLCFECQKARIQQYTAEHPERARSRSRSR